VLQQSPQGGLQQGLQELQQGFGFGQGPGSQLQPAQPLNAMLKPRRKVLEQQSSAEAVCPATAAKGSASSAARMNLFMSVSLVGAGEERRSP
jgi:hypothetical protein